jgi:hypothetical protein
MMMSLWFPQGVVWRVRLASEVRAEFANGNVFDEVVAAGRKPMPRSLGILHPAGGESLSSGNAPTLMRLQYKNRRVPALNAIRGGECQDKPGIRRYQSNSRFGSLGVEVAMTLGTPGRGSLNE